MTVIVKRVRKVEGNKEFRQLVSDERKKRQKYQKKTKKFYSSNLRLTEKFNKNFIAEKWKWKIQDEI